MGVTMAEQETIILFNEAEATATIYTYNERLKAQIAEYARHNPDKMGENTLDKTGALHCELPKRDLRVLLKKPRSEKQLQASRENVRKMREKLNLSPSAEG